MRTDASRSPGLTPRISLTVFGENFIKDLVDLYPRCLTNHCEGRRTPRFPLYANATPFNIQLKACHDAPIFLEGYSADATRRRLSESEPHIALIAHIIASQKACFNLKVHNHRVKATGS